MKKLYYHNINFYRDLKNIIQKRSQQNIPVIDNEVKIIINNIIINGNKALIEYAKKFDNSDLNKENILLSDDIKVSYKNKIKYDTLDAFKISMKNIINFHQKQFPVDYEIISKGVKTKSFWKPIDSVGLYIPGGEAAYPSSLLMNVLPAKVAGVRRIVVATPSKSNHINPYVLALIDELKIEEVYQIGGAHAIAALAYGTESIKPVDKIFGPGNAYVASAKKQVFGDVGIDTIAGPSEIVVVADNKNNPDWVAADLIAQAEHDNKAQSILITDDEDFAKKVEISITKLSKKLTKKDIINSSLSNFGIIIMLKNLDDFDEIGEIIDFIAPEHLHLQSQNRYEVLEKVNNAGGIFLGSYSTEAFGDYIVGTNHILPTSGSARFASGVGVLDFMKRSSLVELDKEGYEINKENVTKMAEVENLDGHKLSVKIRQIEKK